MTENKLLVKESMTMLRGKIVGSSFVKYDETGRQVFAMGSGGVGGTLQPALLTRTTFTDGVVIVTVRPGRSA